MLAVPTGGRRKCPRFALARIPKYELWREASEHGSAAGALRGGQMENGKSGGADVVLSVRFIPVPVRGAIVDLRWVEHCMDLVRVIVQ